jgi:coenzyme F420-0:L-glutamate ligase
VLTVLPVRGLPEVAVGDDLAALILGVADLADGDVLVVSQKVVSKAEGALVELAPGEDIARARRRLARHEATRVVAESPWVLVVETAHGFVCANAGIDASNVAHGYLALLPPDPDASARRLRGAIRERCGAEVAVVIADTFGRPWRLGQTDVAIGIAGMRALRDERGGRDRQGRILDVTEAAVADEVAAAADLVRGKADGIPAAIVRGLAWERDEAATARDLIRPADEDMFRAGRGGLSGALARTGAMDLAVEQGDLSAAWDAAQAQAPGPVTVVDLSGSGGGPTRIGVMANTAGAEPAAGVVAGVLLALLVDRGYSARFAGPRRNERALLVVEAGRARRSGSVPGGRSGGPPGRR